MNSNKHNATFYVQQKFHAANAIIFATQSVDAARFTHMVMSGPTLALEFCFKLASYRVFEKHYIKCQLLSHYQGNFS